MRIVFLGSGDIGLPTLRALMDAPQHDLCAVFTQPDKPFGRKAELRPPQTKVFAESVGVPVHQPGRIRSKDSLALLKQYQPEVIVVVAYGQILPKAVLDLPKIACLNLHASILPRHRGAAPIQAAILAGDAESGMSVMYMDEGLDTGDVLLVHRLPLGDTETGGSLHDQLAGLGPATMLKALDLLQAGKAPRQPQDHAAATHQGKLERSDGEIDWNEPARQIERRVRAFDPWPGTTTRLGGQTLKIFPPIEIAATTGGEPGEVLEASPAGLIVACGEGALRITGLQPAGKKRMAVGAFLAGHPVESGSRLG